MMKWYLLGLAAIVAPGAASAQVIPENTPITVQTLEPITSKEAQVGDPVRMEVIDDVVVNGVTVISAGTPAYGEVTAAQKNGHFGKSGKLTIEVEGVRYGSGRMRLRGSRNNKGAGGSTAALAAGATVLKLFPAEAASPAVLRAMRAVLPPATRVLPVGGVDAATMAGWLDAGAAGFGLGSSLYRAGDTAAQVAAKAVPLRDALQSAQSGAS